MLKEKNRESNFELLRIVSMFIIILYHYCIFSSYYNPTRIDNVSLNFLLVKLFSFGSLGNHIFILITGYFMVKSKVNYKKIISLILEMFFYSITLTSIFYGFRIVEFDLETFIHSLFPIIWGNWFLIYYVLLYFLIPYINMFIEKINQTQMKKLICTLLILYTIVPTFTKNAWSFTQHNVFILDYLIGAYFRLYPIKQLKSNKFNIAMIILAFLINIEVGFIFIILGKVLGKDILIIMCNYLLGLNNYSIISLIVAVLIFSIFKNIKIQSKKINYISASILGVYLIHENDILKNWLWRKFWPGTNLENSCLLILHMFTKTLLVFIVCIIIDKIRIVLFKKIEDSLSDKIYNLFKKIRLKLKKDSDSKIIIS